MVIREQIIITNKQTLTNTLKKLWKFFLSTRPQTYVFSFDFQSFLHTTQTMNANLWRQRRWFVLFFAKSL